MFDKFVPDIYAKSIYTIDYASLKKKKVKCLIFDLNNTIAPLTLKKPNKKLLDLFEELKDMKFKIYIVSNSSKKRVEPFKDNLCVDSAYLAFKPSLRKFKKILDITNYKENQIACIGDELISDIWASNRMNFVSILVNPMGSKEYVSTKLGRLFENYIIDKLTNKKLFRRGKYYE
ncbi:MAG: HAD hydrolase-like protein [Bacilli bacterium]|nr:HAD hydrolase-like protein [Bacilli bacterium]